MSEGKDPAIKLFGRKIPLQEGQAPMEEGGAADSAPAMEPSSSEEKDTSKEKPNLELVASSVSNNSTEVATEPSTEPPKQDRRAAAAAAAAAAADESKLLRKPDKLLPCPRCNSTDTKFCYFNNHNVNQPRHFCKSCQRYWTAGGSTRSVPVGAGRRRNRHGSSAAASAQPGGGRDSINGTVLKFGPDAPLCESMASALNLGERSATSPPDFAARSESGEEASCSPALNSPLPQLRYFPGPLWAFPWNPGWNQPPLSPSPPLPFPFPFLPPFWSGWAWNVPWNSDGGSSPSSSSTSTGCCSGNASPALGKHSREEPAERSLWIPKTLRIEDRDEAAKSSIFATLGIEPDEAAKFRAFSWKKAGNGKKEKGEEEEEASNASRVLRANPAALSRSQSFQEMTS